MIIGQNDTLITHNDARSKATTDPFTHLAIAWFAKKHGKGVHLTVTDRLSCTHRDYGWIGLIGNIDDGVVECGKGRITQGGLSCGRVSRLTCGCASA